MLSDMQYLVSSGARPDFPLYPTTKLSFRRIQIVTRLQVDPKTRCGAEITRKAKCRVGSNAAVAPHDIVDSRPRCLNCLRERVDADFHRHQEVVTQNFTRMNERKPLPGGHLGEVDPTRIQIFAFDAHSLAPHRQCLIYLSINCRAAGRGRAALPPPPRSRYRRRARPPWSRRSGVFAA